MILYTARPKAPAAPLAVFHDTAPCDAKHRHEVTFISDGTRAYAYGPITDPITPVHRDGVYLTAECGQPVEGDEPCTGQVRVSIDTPGTWTTSPDSRRLLAALGQEIER